MDAILKSLGIDTGLFIIQVVGFILLYILLARFLFGPIKAILTERKEEIRNTYDAAEQNRQAMEQLRADYEQRIAGVEVEARARIQEALKEAQAAREQIVNEARESSHEIIERSRKEIEHERDRALAALRAEVTGLAIGAAGKILDESLDEPRHRKLVEDFINQIGRA